MIAGVADTHAALWYFFDDLRLSSAAGDFIYLVEKNRLPANAYTDLKAALDDPDHVFKEASFTGDVVDSMRLVPRAEVPDMPDRIVAATGVYLGVPVISRDGRIRASNVLTVCECWTVSTSGVNS